MTRRGRRFLGIPQRLPPFFGGPRAVSDVEAAQRACRFNAGVQHVWHCARERPSSALRAWLRSPASQGRRSTATATSGGETVRSRNVLFNAARASACSIRRVASTTSASATGIAAQRCTIWPRLPERSACCRRCRARRPHCAEWVAARNSVTCGRFGGRGGGLPSRGGFAGKEHSGERCAGGGDSGGGWCSPGRAGYRGRRRRGRRRFAAGSS